MISTTIIIGAIIGLIIGGFIGWAGGNAYDAHQIRSNLAIPMMLLGMASGAIFGGFIGKSFSKKEKYELDKKKRN